MTHPNRWCIDACAVFAATLTVALPEGNFDLGAAASRAAEPEVREAVVAASANPTPEMSGFVLRTLTGALWAVAGADSYDDAVWRAVSLGEDADTVGAVTGALAGTQWGEAAIALSLRAGITSRHPLFGGAYPGKLESLADDLIDLRDR